MKIILRLILATLLMAPFGLASSVHPRGTWFIDYRNLVEYISDKYGKPEYEIYEVVRLAEKSVGKLSTDFPTTLDVLTVIGIESGFNPNARNAAGPSLGLMQVNAQYHRVPGLTKPGVNIDTGVGILADYGELAESENQALLSYNMGPNRAKTLCRTVKSCTGPYIKKFKNLKFEFASIHRNQRS